MLNLTFNINQAFYLAECCEEIDDCMIRLRCQQYYFNKYYSEEGLKDVGKKIVNTTISAIKKVINKCIELFKSFVYLIKSIKSGLNKAKKVIDDSLGDSRKFHPDTKVKFCIMQAWCMALTRSDLTNAKEVSKHYEEEWNSDNNRKQYLHDYKSNNVQMQITSLLTDVDDILQKLIYVRNLVNNQIEKSTNQNFKVTSHHYKLLDTIDKYLYSQICVLTKKEQKSKEKVNTFVQVFNRVSLKINEIMQAFAIWMKYYRKTLGLEQSDMLRKKGQKGILRFYNIPDNVRLYLTNYMKKFYDTKGHALFRAKRITVVSSTDHSYSNTNISGNPNSFNCVINSDLFLNKPFENLMFTVLHEFTHVSQNMHKKELNAYGIHKLTTYFPDQRYIAAHDDQIIEQHADTVARAFLKDFKNGKIPKNNPFCVWLKSVKIQLQKYAESIHYTSTKLKDLDKEVDKEVQKRMK